MQGPKLEELRVGGEFPRRLRGSIAAVASIVALLIAASLAYANGGAPPVNTIAPTVSGTAEVGQTLTAGNGTWTGDPTPTYAYQWQRCEGDVDSWSGYSAATGTDTTYWNDVVFGGSLGSEQFVAVGSNLAAGTASSRVMTSPDGATWTARSDPGSATDGNQWESVTYGEGLYVAVGTEPRDKFMTSPDGINWTYRSSIPTSNWVSVTYGGGRFVAVDDVGGVQWSDDGISWSAATTPASGLTSAIGHGNGQFVIVGNDSVFTSPDGDTWTQAPSPPGSLFLRDVTYGGGKWVAVGTANGAGSATNIALTSTDGTSWTQQTVPSKSWWGVTYGPSGFTVVGRDPSGNVIAISPDGTTWTGQTSPALELYGVAAGAGTTVAVGSGSGITNAVARPAYTCTDISGANASTYTLTGADEGKKIRVKVTASNSQGSTYALSPATGAVLPRPFPASTAPPTVTGTAQVGEPLSASTGTWIGNPSYSYQWERCEANVSTTTYTAGDLAAYPVLDSAGNLYVTNQGNDNVTKITPAGTSSTFGPTGTDTDPFGIAIDPYRNIYTANQGNTGATPNSVSKLLASGTPAGSPWPVTVGTTPTGIAIDSSGNIFTSNKGADTISKILPDGTLAGGIPAWASTGSQPYGIGVDSSGNVYTANFLSNTVSKILANGSPAGSPWPSTTGTLTRPVGLALDSSGNIYTANYNLGYATKITPSGSSLLLAYTGYQPWGIAVDPFGNVYTADSGDDTVTKITPDGNATTLGSTGSAPRGIAVDSAGNVFTANADSDNVTKISQYSCSDISGATNPTYTLTAPDETKLVRVKVTGTNPTGTGWANSALTTAVGPAATPTNNTAPTISGTPEVGQTLTADPGTWTGSPTFAYQWQRCDADGNNCVDISGATNQTYQATSADEGKKLRVRVTATNSGGSASANSAQIGPVQGAPVSAPSNTSPPAIAGDSKVGGTLTGSPGTWTGSPTLTYQWLRCDSNGENCVEISGATGETYQPTSADEGMKLKIKVTATNSAGSSSATSEAFGPITDSSAAKPKLKVWVYSPKKVKAGRTFRIRVRVKNTASAKSVRAATTTAKNVKTCASLPKGIFVVKAKGGKVQGRTVCWKRSQLKAGQSASYSVEVRSSKTDQGEARIAATSSASASSGASAKAKAKSTLQVVEPERPKPTPPTG